ncbi:MAG: TylF/MycF/NovP-related O-methyltransferase, partial [Pyrinomonadaceae bacterium]
SLVKVPDADELYDRDGLISVHNHDFMADPSFQKAYARGVLAAGDYGWQWRVHIGLWAAKTCARLDGDFVECGVNRGFLSSAIMEYLDWDATGKTFYLLDTFAGLDDRQISGDVSAAKRNEKHLAEGFYVHNAESVRANFSEWKNVRIIEGPVPDTLDEIEAAKIAYLHLDMNSAPPEVAAFNSLWNRLVPGAIVLLDDYAYYGYEAQKIAMDQAAAAKGIDIASLPTGQGLAIKTV